MYIDEEEECEMTVYGWDADLSFDFGDSTSLATMHFAGGLNVSKQVCYKLTLMYRLTFTR